MQSGRQKLMTTMSKRRAFFLLLSFGGFFDCVLPFVNAQNVTAVDANENNNTAAAGNDGCFSTLRSLNEAMSQKEPFVQVEYNLCPHTVFSVGVNRGADGFFGEEPLQPRSNSVIRCGKSGSPQDNCIIEGGDAQLQLFWTAHPEGYNENVVVEGITFQSVSPKRVAIALVSSGYVDFRRCIFKSHHNAQVVAVLHRPSQEEFLEVTFDSCVFEANSLLRNGSPLPRSSLISGGSAFTTLIVRNSVFVDNNLQDDNFKQSDIIHVQAGGGIKMENNCFINNNVVGDGVISVIDSSDVLLARGNFGTRIQGSSCDFLFLEKESSCQHYDFPQCALNYTNGVLTPPPPGFVPEFSVVVPTLSPTTTTSSGMSQVSGLGFLLVALMLLQ